MPSDLRTKSEAVWDAIVAKIDAAMAADGALSAVRGFDKVRRSKFAQVPSPLLTVLSRPVEVRDWGAARSIAVMTVQFGLTVTTFKPGEAGEDLWGLAWSLHDVFMDDPTLNGVVHDSRLVSLDPDAPPPGENLPTQPWAIIELSWDYDHLVER